LKAPKHDAIENSNSIIITDTKLVIIKFPFYLMFFDLSFVVIVKSDSLD